MTPLSDALTAAQQRALAAMQKQYVAGRIDADTARSFMNSSGLTDSVDQDRLLFTLDAIAAWGVEPPAEPSNGKPADEPATDKQLGFIADLLSKVKLSGPDLPLTKAQAGDIID